MIPRDSSFLTRSWADGPLIPTSAPSSAYGRRPSRWSTSRIRASFGLIRSDVGIWSYRVTIRQADRLQILDLLGTMSRTDYSDRRSAADERREPGTGCRWLRGDHAAEVSHVRDRTRVPGAVLSD